VTRFAWLLNLDADRELATAGDYTPSPRVLARSETLIPHIRGLMTGRDVRVVVGLQLQEPLPGRAWCPTPGALRALAAAGAELPAAPPLEVLKRVNSRRFCAELGQQLTGAAFVDALALVSERVTAATDSGHWLLKRPHGFVGTGRRKVAVGQLTSQDESWARASLAMGGLQVEPWVERVGDVALHGWLSPTGRATLGQACSQRCNETGAWLGTEVAGDALGTAERQQLEREGTRVAEALAAAGYFGPFGVDGYRYRREGGVAFNPRSEINARYTMGWAVGMAGQRPDLADS